MDLVNAWRRQVRAGLQKMFDLAEQPGAALRGAPDHERVGPGGVEHLTGFFRRDDVAVGDHRNVRGGLDGGNRVVFGMTGIAAGACAAMHGERPDARLLGDGEDRQGVAVGLVPAGADLQRDRRFGDGVDHGFKNAADQRLVLEQGRPGHHVADLLGGAAHVDVDDLGAAVDVVARRFRHHFRHRSGDLHGNRRDLTVVIGPSLRLGAAVKQRIRGDHLGYGQPRPQLLAELAERTVRDAGHGRDEQIVPERKAEIVHGVGASVRRAGDFTDFIAQKIVKFFPGKSNFRENNHLVERP